MQEDNVHHFDTPDVETLHTLLSDMTISPPSPTNSNTDPVTPAPPPLINLWTRLPLELRHQILSDLLSSLLTCSLHIFAASSCTPTPRPTPNPLLETLQALLSTNTIFRIDLRVPLNTLCADLTRRWHRLLHDAHARLYEHVDAQFATGVVIADVFSVEEALRKCSYAGNEYYQSVATRVLYGEPGGLSDGMLGRVAAGWEGMFRIWWELEVSRLYCLVFANFRWDTGGDDYVYRGHV